MGAYFNKYGTYKYIYAYIKIRNYIFKEIFRYLCQTLHTLENFCKKTKVDFLIYIYKSLM